MLIPAVQLKQVSRGFGMFSHSLHTGVDLTAPYGSPVRAALGGTVAFVGAYSAYGNIVDVSHGDAVLTRYAHLSAFAIGVHPGTRLQTGQALGSVGTSGNAHGSHLHFEVRVAGRPVDPKPFLALASCPVGKPSIVTEEARAPESPLAQQPVPPGAKAVPARRPH